MLTLMLTVASAALLDSDPRPPLASDVRAAHELLKGTWRIVSVADNGDPIGPTLVRRKMVKNGELRVAKRTITQINPESG